MGLFAVGFWIMRAFWYYEWIEGEIVDEAMALEEKVSRLDLLSLFRRFGCLRTITRNGCGLGLYIIDVHNINDHLEQNTVG